MSVMTCISIASPPIHAWARQMAGHAMQAQDWGPMHGWITLAPRTEGKYFLNSSWRLKSVTSTARSPTKMEWSMALKVR